MLLFVDRSRGLLPGRSPGGQMEKANSLRLAMEIFFFSPPFNRATLFNRVTRKRARKVWGGEAKGGLV